MSSLATLLDSQPSTSSANGRVNLIAKTRPPDTSKLFAMFDKIPAHQCTKLQNPTMGLWENTPLANSFFSRQNIQILQNGIRAGVFYKSNQQYVIGPQDCDALKVIMRSVFLQHAANQPTNIAGQIEELNKIVLDYCVFHVYSEAQGYMKYLTDVSTLYVPLSTPIMEKQRDKNNYEMPSWF